MHPLRALSILLIAGIAGCSGGGTLDRPSAIAPPAGAPLQALRATGRLTLTIARKPAAARLRRPAYISSATTHANLSIDGAVTAGTCVDEVCTVSWTATPGTHTFTAEVDDGAYVLAAGSQVYNLDPGLNNLAALTLNGVADTIQFPTSGAITDQSGMFSISDAGDELITTPGTFDNLAGLTTTNPSIGVLTDDVASTAGYLLPDAIGSDYTFTVSCVVEANGIFRIAATTAAPASNIDVASFSLTYPDIFVASDTYECTNGTLSVL